MLDPVSSTQVGCRPHGSLRPVRHPNFAEDRFNMDFDRRFSDGELPRNHLVRLSFHQVLQDLNLPAR